VLEIVAGIRLREVISNEFAADPYGRRLGTFRRVHHILSRRGRSGNHPLDRRLRLGVWNFTHCLGIPSQEFSPVGSVSVLELKRNGNPVGRRIYS
jgi:hypothetical protein